MARTAVVQTLETLLPDVAVGDRFDILAGSRVGRLRVRGSVDVTSRDERSASIGVACRVLGVRSNGSIDVALEPDGSISIAVRGLSFLSIAITGRPEVLSADQLTLAIESGGRLDVAGDDQQLEIATSGLRVGEIRISLAGCAE